MNGIGPMLPMQTITLPGGQTVQIPQINMEEINANLAAAGIAPTISPPSIPAPTMPTPVPVPQVQDITIANPREDFMSIERMPVDMTPVSPLPAPTPTPVASPPTYTPPPAPREDMPFVPSVRQVATGLDPLTEQLLFGLGGEGGFISSVLTPK